MTRLENLEQGLFGLDNMGIEFKSRKKQQRGVNSILESAEQWNYEQEHANDILPEQNTPRRFESIVPKVTPKLVPIKPSYRGNYNADLTAPKD